MVATSVTFSPKVAADWDPQKALTTTKLNKLFDNTTNVHERLGGSYDATVKDHNHDGQNSALIEVGPNFLRNSSFESGSSSWTLVDFTGGTHAVQTTGAMHGKYCLAITSTVLANGGGSATSNDYIPVSPGRSYSFGILAKASVANISMKLEILWYDSTQAQISSSALSYTNVSTAQQSYGQSIAAPANAAYARVKVTGGVPASGSATGTVYFDGCYFNSMDVDVPDAQAGNFYSSVSGSVGGGTFGWSEFGNFRCLTDGYYRTSFYLQSTDGYTTDGQVYRNGAAYGSYRSLANAAATYTEDLYFSAGDTVQFLARKQYNGGGSGQGGPSKLGVANITMPIPVLIQIGER